MGYGRYTTTQGDGIYREAFENGELTDPEGASQVVVRSLFGGVEATLMVEEFKLCEQSASDDGKLSRIIRI